MANTLSAFNTPVLWINSYLQEKFSELIVDNPETAEEETAGIGVPFFPSRPASIDQLTEDWVIIGDQRLQYAGVITVLV